MQALNSIKSRIGLADIFSPETIIIGLEQRSKKGVLEELVHPLVELKHLGQQEEEKTIVQNILAREKIGSTALGGGIATPHCRTSLTEKFLGVVGVDHRGIPFDALDGEPVFHIFLLLAPLESREEIYDVLGRLFAISRNKSLRYQLRGCKTVTAVHEFLQELDRQ